VAALPHSGQRPSLQLDLSPVNRKPPGLINSANSVDE